MTTFRKDCPAFATRSLATHLGLGHTLYDPCKRMHTQYLKRSSLLYREKSCVRCSADTYSRDLSSAPRLIQHKNEAKAFYAFLSLVYDHIVNPGHWTVDMRDDALEPAQLNDRDLSVCDVGGGTGFCTQGIVKHVDPKNVTLLDQSPQQLSKARAKKDLEGVTIIEGDAEDLPFETDSFDRCVRYPTYSLPLLSLSSLCCFFSLGPFVRASLSASPIFQCVHQHVRTSKAGVYGVVQHTYSAQMMNTENDLRVPCCRYVSAGSIEYWPQPERGICEAYRILKPGGVACIIGPVHPTNPFSRAMADLWMLFPKESEYMEWFERAGFEDVKIKRIGPKWYRGVRRHGLIMGCSVTGVKKASGPSKEIPPKAEQSSGMNTNPISFALRLILGMLGGFWFFLLPIYMWLKNLIWPHSGPLADKF